MTPETLAGRSPSASTMWSRIRKGRKMKKWAKKMMFCRHDIDEGKSPIFHGAFIHYGKKCWLYQDGKCGNDNRPCIVHEYVKVKK